MEERFACSPAEAGGMDTAQLREHFLLPGLFEAGEVRLAYSHYDRVVAGGIMPAGTELKLTAFEPLKSSFFLERRELGLINIGGPGRVWADGTEYTVDKLDCLYLGRGTEEVRLSSSDSARPARYFLLSAPAHQAYPNRLMKSGEALPASLGTQATSNERTIYKYIHEEGIRSCQLVMGLTLLREGSVWNTMPAHTHHRRMEVYLYFDLPEGQRVFHLMGPPGETRHLVVANEEGVISPPWSIHSGCGTASYSFIWGMAGENQAFSDMDFVDISQLR